MPNFTAKESGEDKAAMVNKIPAMDGDTFGINSAAGSAMHREFTYVTRKHTLVDVLRPHYFDDARDFGAREWDIINCTIGDDPGTAVSVDLRIIDAPRTREKPVLVAKGEAKKFTPVRHGGDADPRATKGE